MEPVIMMGISGDSIAALTTESADETEFKNCGAVFKFSLNRRTPQQKAADDNDAIKISYIYECRTITYINIISIRCEAVLQLQPD